MIKEERQRAIQRFFDNAELSQVSTGEFIRWPQRSIQSELKPLHMIRNAIWLILGSLAYSLLYIALMLTFLTR
jgi:hypothetical protein